MAEILQGLISQFGIIPVAIILVLVILYLLSAAISCAESYLATSGSVKDTGKLLRCISCRRPYFPLESGSNRKCLFCSSSCEALSSLHGREAHR